MTQNLAGLSVVRAGLVAYDVARREQQRLHEAVVAGDCADTVLLLEHPSAYTAGKRTNSWDRPTDGTPVIDVDRGGRITWHGPGQIVGYPILKLANPVDVVAYVRRVEQMLIDVCAELGLATTRIDGRSGVWVPAGARGADRKVAALGIRVARSVTLHGFALNCDCDLAAYDKIVPCGISDAGVTSLTAELGRRVVRIDQMGSFACRRVNGSNRISQHASGLAIDIGGFRLSDGTTVSVEHDWNEPGPKRLFLRHLARQACGYFSVVLTPDSNADHRDHLHLDIGPDRLCSA